MIFDFSIFFIIFLTDLILSDQTKKDMDRYGILSPFRKWAYFPPISKPRAKKNYFRFFDIEWIFFFFII